MAFAHDIRTAETGLAHRISAFFKTAAARYNAWRLEQRTFRELAALSDRELDDLGLNRSMLRSVAHDASLHH